VVVGGASTNSLVVISQCPRSIWLIQAFHLFHLWQDVFGNYIKQGNKHSYWDTWHDDGRIEKVKIDAIQVI